jgi:hypothetical protein
MKRICTRNYGSSIPRDVTHNWPSQSVYRHQIVLGQSLYDAPRVGQHRFCHPDRYIVFLVPALRGFRLAVGGSNRYVSPPSDASRIIDRTPVS